MRVERKGRVQGNLGFRNESDGDRDRDRLSKVHCNIWYRRQPLVVQEDIGYGQKVQWIVGSGLAVEGMHKNAQGGWKRIGKWSQ